MNVWVSVHTRVCFFSNGASPSNTNTGLIRKKRSLQIRWKRVSRWAFWTLLPSRSLTPFTAWFSHILISGSVWLKLMHWVSQLWKRWREDVWCATVCSCTMTNKYVWNVCSMCTVTCWEHLQSNPFSHKDTNSKYLSFKSLGVDGFPCTLQ